MKVYDIIVSLYGGKKYFNAVAANSEEDAKHIVRKQMGFCTYKISRVTEREDN